MFLPGIHCLYQVLKQKDEGNTKGYETKKKKCKWRHFLNLLRKQTKLKQSLKPIGGLINKHLQSKGHNNYALHITRFVYFTP